MDDGKATTKSTVGYPDLSTQKSNANRNSFHLSIFVDFGILGPVFLNEDHRPCREKTLPRKAASLLDEGNPAGRQNKT